MPTTTDINCPYCGEPAKLVTGKTIYPHRRDLHDKPFYECAECGAYVGCHPGTTDPIGTLANARTRRARTLAHAAFDPLWRDKSGLFATGGHRRFNYGEARRRAYVWLAKQMDVTVNNCHIGMFDESQCARVVELCEAIKARQA